MKKFLALVLLATFLGAWAQTNTNTLTLTDTVRLVWDANKEPDIAGYTVYALGATNYTVFTVSTQVFMVAELFKTNRVKPGVYTFFVTAKNTAGLESEPSSNLVLNTGYAPTAVLTTVIKADD